MKKFFSRLLHKLQSLFNSSKKLTVLYKEKVAEEQSWLSNQNTRLIILVSFAGILAFFTIASFAPFRNRVLNALFPKNPSLAAGLECDGSDSTNAPDEAAIQAALDNVSEGGTFNFPPCVFRGTLKIKKSNITIQGSDYDVGFPYSTISGSDIFTSWNRSGIYAESVDLVPDFGLDPAADPKNEWCKQKQDHTFYPCSRQEQVYFNNQVLGDFSLTPDRKIRLNPVWLLQRPNVIEVTVRSKWIEADSSIKNITIKNMAFTAAANNTGTAGLTLGDGWKVYDSNLARAHGAAIGIKGNDVTIEKNVIDYNGQTGIAGSGGNIKIINNKIYNNNTAFVNPGYEAGGIKLSAVSGSSEIKNNEVHGNFGPGIWCDVGCTDIDISGNRIYENAWYGIGYEISRRGKIHDNYIYNNGLESDNYTFGMLGSGIWLSNASETEVNNNILAWNADGITVLSQDRYCEPGYTGRIFDFEQDRSGLLVLKDEPINGWLRPNLLNNVSNNNVHHNTIAASFVGEGLVYYYQAIIQPSFPSHIFSWIQTPPNDYKDVRGNSRSFDFSDKNGNTKSVYCPAYRGSLLASGSNNQAHDNIFFYTTATRDGLSSFPSFANFIVTDQKKDGEPLVNIDFSGLQSTPFGQDSRLVTNAADYLAYIRTPLASHNMPEQPLDFPFPIPQERVTVQGVRDTETKHCRQWGSICGTPINLPVPFSSGGVIINSEIRIDSVLTIN